MSGRWRSDPKAVEAVEYLIGLGMTSESYVEQVRLLYDGVGITHPDPKAAEAIEYLLSLRPYFTADDYLEADIRSSGETG